ncbi:MAG: prenyltransferase/squalene oxidase repeat-containing protein, partial [Planctomycetota bacterium]
MKPTAAENVSSPSSAASAAPARRVAKGASASPQGTPGAKPPDARRDPDRRNQLAEPNAWVSEALRQTPSWLVSMVVHMILLLALALLTLPAGVSDELRQLVIAPEEDEPLDDLEDLDYEPPQEIDVSTELVAVETEIPQENVEISPADDVEAAAVAVELSDYGFERAPRNDLLATVGAYTGTALSGRGTGARAGLLKKYGGTPASEKAVAAALKWLAEHQLYDGGWSFDHNRAAGCGGRCRNPGKSANARNAATGLALLPFLGAGQTHQSGKYKATVKNGLYFLIKNMKHGRQGWSFYEGDRGRMYSHGIASIVMCEAYGMTHDKSLHLPAQEAVNFICYAQDPVGGGWRYEPRQKGDTSVVGWQIMALKSGHMSYLRVPPVTVKRASQFLDSVQANYGANYGYTAPAGNRDATTAIGLLCRMYLGWKKEHPGLQRGVQWISDLGPSKT